jgi:hypothetical protein
MDHPDRDRIIAREMGWDHMLEMLDAEEAGKQAGEGERDAADGTSGGASDDDDQDDGEVDDVAPDDYEEPEPDPATEGKDWVRNKHGHIKHPLSHRAFESAIGLWHRIKELGLSEDRDEDLGVLSQEFSILGAKLAGALDGMAQDRCYVDHAHNIARMKRGLTHLHAAQAALVNVEQKQLLPAEDLEKTRSELFAIREEMLRLMEEFRQK